jgi:hypothetical protein
VPQSTDQDAAGFGLQIESVEDEGEGNSVHGVLRRGKTGNYTLVTPSKMGEWGLVLQKYVDLNKESAEFAALENLRIIRLRQGHMADLHVLSSIGAPAQELSLNTEMIDRLQNLGKGKSILFVFSDDGLFVSDSKNELIDYGKTLPKDVKLQRGTIERAKGYYLFKVRKDGRGLLERIAGWWQGNGGSKSLPCLVGSRLVELDKSKEIVYRKRADQLWGTK